MSHGNHFPILQGCVDVHRLIRPKIPHIAPDPVRGGATRPTLQAFSASTGGPDSMNLLGAALTWVATAAAPETPEFTEFRERWFRWKIDRLDETIDVRSHEYINAGNCPAIS